MFFSSRNAAILIFITFTVFNLGVFGVVTSGASEPIPTKITAVSGISASPETANPDEISRKKFAVIIGIVYDNSELGVVEFADWDAASLHGLLTQRLGFPAENVILLKNQDATREKIIAALEWLATNPEIDSESDVVFYYSGHGLRNAPDIGLNAPQTAPGYALVPFDFKNFDYKTGAGLLWDGQLADYLSRINPGRMWITIDSCFSGGFDRPGISGPNRVVTLSSQAGELSGEIRETRRGVFTQFMVDEGIARGLSVEQAYGAAAPRASGGYGQNPQIADNYPGNMVFFQPPASN